MNMEYDSESSFEGHPKDIKTTKKSLELKEQKEEIHKGQTSYCSITSLSNSSKDVPKQSNISLRETNKNLSSQVMEYYQQYSHNSNLDQYFSLPSSNLSTESVNYYYNAYELNSKLGNNRQDCIGEEYHLPAYVPRERRRWVRPPLIGQSSSTESSTLYIQPLTNPQSPSPDLKHSTIDKCSEIKNDNQQILLDNNERKISSPTSSVASHKPLEWDSGADVGYYNSLPHNKHNNKKLSTIERMALARGCSAALRLDPEGTTESGIIGKNKIIQNNSKSLKTPKASSTLITENISESESEIEITPIMKNMLPGIITGSDIKSEEKKSPKHSKLNVINPNLKEKDSTVSSQKSSYILKIPFVKHSIERKEPINNKNTNNEDFCSNSLLKKSTSMNTITQSTSKNILKRSQSELNLYAKDKNKLTLPLIFNSTSSISTVVNKPTTCDKVIQTSLNTFSQESVGIQVSVQEEEKPPLPKRGTSLQRSLQSILKNPKNTYKIQNSITNKKDHKSNVACVRKEIRKKTYNSSSDVSQSESTPLIPQFDEAENISGRVNSFEYFPGHIYENVPNGRDSRVSSIHSEESTSTFPNTSSSLSEKLWGNSNSLVRDLERSVNILKSLVDANKCDKQVKKRLIHHVVKRLVTARYTDDKIDHNLEDNVVPWHPDNPTQKVYQTESLRESKNKHSTSTSSDNWKTSTKSCSIPKSIKNDRETLTRETLASSNSDKFDGNTDRTEMDGRKARMSLRTDNCPQSSNTSTEPDRSQSSECFIPQQNQKGNKMKNTFYLKDKCKALQLKDTTSTNSSPPDCNRMLLDAVLSRKTSTSSSKNTENNINSEWRFPTTLSERQFELKRCRSSNPGDLKLVDYAETEKRNQLLWITNEISHLSNLKKLLEQPRRLERSKSSPRKLKPALFKTKPVHIMTQEKSVDTDFVYKDASNSKGNSIGEQWSSHCNLATCHSTDTNDTNNIQRIKKRNSSSQTATEIIDAHSKTGGEIVTSKAQNTMKPVNMDVQTCHQEIFPNTSYLQNGTMRPSTCLIHKSLTRSLNKCKYVNQEEQDEKNILQAIPNGCLYCLEGQPENQPIKTKCHHIPIRYDFAKEDSETATESTRVSLVNSNSVSSSQENHYYIDKSKNQLKQKETKNQINASKSKYACNCQSTLKTFHNKCKCGINKTNTTYQNKLPETCPIHGKSKIEIIGTVPFCELCRTRTYNSYKNSCTCKKQEKSIESTSATINGCTCTNEVINETQTNMFTMRSDRSYHQDNKPIVTDCNNQQNIVNLCGCSNGYTYENKLESENRMPNASYETCSNLKTEYNKRYHSKNCSKSERHQIHTRSYYLVNAEENLTSLQPKVQTRIKCNCSKDCSCPNKIKEDKNNGHRTKHNTESNDINGSNPNDSDKNYKCCRTCGKVYQNTRKCNCRQTYPKPVAYEISFTNKNSQKNISTIKKKMPLSNTINDTVKSDQCTCTSKNQKENNKNDKNTTLQDYLSKNKPEFVNNAETRRQYVSEIAHLRQLRKEKRIQLLAMASTSNSMKFPKSYKPSVNVQKRITDEEIKERLRKRYRRLNEVRVKRREQERQEETRRNKLMAKIFCKKLQQKVLKGQVDLSQSVSVISNL